MKLLAHPDVRFARTAVWALALYTGLEPPAERKLLDRLLATLVSAEKTLARKKKKKNQDAVKRAESLVVEIPKTLAKLTGKEGAKTAAEWKDALKDL